MAGIGDEKLTVDKLTGKNYSTWKFKIKHWLIAKELWGLIDGSTAEPASEADEAVKAAYVKKSNQAMSIVVLSVSDDLLYLITSCVSPKAAWNALQNHFERDTLTNKLFLKKQYFRTVMREDASIEQHIRYMKELTDKLAAVNSSISEEDQVVTLLGSLPSSYATLVTALEARFENLTLSYVQQALLSEEQRRKEQHSAPNSSNTDTALAAGNNRRYGKQKRTCFKCGSPDHLIRNCPQLTQESTHNAKPATEHVTQDIDSAFLVSSGEKDNDWLIDSGASSHMTHNKSLFKVYNTFETPQKVTLGDGHILEAVGSGNIEIFTLTRDKQVKPNTMYDVLHVPGLKANLFSVRSAAEKHLIVQFGHSRCWLKNKSGKLRATGTLYNKLYYLDTINSAYHAASPASNTDLWHQRLGHAGIQCIKSAHQNRLVIGADLSNVHVGVCEPCIKGKMTRKPFDKHVGIKSSRPLELVHTDVCGPMQTKSIGGSTYFVSFIDDFSRYSYVYFMNEKSEVFARFKEFQALVENQTGLSISTLRSDNGGEYKNNNLEQYLLTHGIEHQTTVRYSPEQNGVAERFNRTVCESARAMIVESGLPKSFWAEAINTAVYTRNRLPTKATSTTPHERWFGHKPNISHIRVFGCAAYSHVPEQLRSKLDSKAENMVLVGYASRSKGYRLYDPNSRKVVIRRDVIFNETKYGVGVIEPIEHATPNTNEFSVDVTSQVNTDDVCCDEPRRSTRPHRPPVRFGIDEYSNSTVETAHIACYAHGTVEPQSYREALISPQSKEWQAAAQAEYDSLVENKTWELVPLPSNRQTIDCKWVFRSKYDKDGNIERYKGRLVARGFTQQAGVDYDETYAPVIKYSSLRALLAYALCNNMYIHQMDVVTAFLNGHLSEEIYMSQPEGFVKQGSEKLVCKLNKSIYGLKQSPRCWNAVLDKFLKSEGFSQSYADQCIYVKNSDNSKTIIAVYVDDLVIMSSTQSTLFQAKQRLTERFAMKDLGELHFLLGISIEHKEDSLKLSQQAFIKQILSKYGMESCNPVSTPAAMDVKLVKSDGSKPVDQKLYQSIIGSLLYLSVATRPDIAHSVGVLSKFNSCPTVTHLTAAKRVLRYLKGTSYVGLTYKRGDGALVGYSDASWADDSDDRHSTTGVAFSYANNLITWLSKRQSTIALSTAESEYIALFEATKEAVWLRQLLTDIDSSASDATVINVDNQSAAAIANNNKSTKRIKHMDIKYHYVREAVVSKNVATKYCPSEIMLADLFTKPMPKTRFLSLSEKLYIK